jgi:hypothetical protein
MTPAIQSLPGTGSTNLGDEWTPSRKHRFGFECAPECLRTATESVLATDDVQRFRSWLQEKVDDGETKHAYSARKAEQRYAKAKDVDRYFVEEYDVFSTVLVTYCAHRQAEESILEHADKFYPQAVTGKRRRLLKGLDVWDEYAAISVLAPKHTDESETRVPGPETTMTHAHDFYWIPGKVPRSDVEGLIDLHMKHVPGAINDINPHEKAVSVRTHQSADVETPPEVIERGSGLDAQRGPTTTLPHEVGNNLPLLQTDLDARGLPEYAEQWCAKLSLGSDGNPTTGGATRCWKRGRFEQIANNHKWRREIRDGVSVGTELAQLL